MNWKVYLKEIVVPNVGGSIILIMCGLGVLAPFGFGQLIRMVLFGHG